MMDDENNNTTPNRAVAGGREIVGLDENRMREVVEMINRARAIEIRRHRERSRLERRARARAVSAPVSRRENDSRRVPGRDNSLNAIRELDLSDYDGSMLIVHMTIVEDGMSRELVALVGTDMTVNTLQQILQAGSWTSEKVQPATRKMMDAVPKVTIRLGKFINRNKETEKCSENEEVAEGEKSASAQPEKDVKDTIVILEVEDMTCVICCDDFKDGEVVRQLPCNKFHCYHEKCIMEWLHRSNSCPMCRKELPTPVAEDDNFTDADLSSAAPTAVSGLGGTRNDTPTNSGHSPQLVEEDSATAANIRERILARRRGGDGMTTRGQTRRSRAGGAARRGQRISSIRIQNPRQAGIPGTLEDMESNSGDEQRQDQRSQPMILRSVRPRSLSDLPQAIHQAIFRGMVNLRESAFDQQAGVDGLPSGTSMYEAARTLHRHLQQLHVREAQRSARSTEATNAANEERSSGIHRLPASAPQPIEPTIVPPHRRWRDSDAEDRQAQSSSRPASLRLPGINNLLQQIPSNSRQPATSGRATNNLRTQGNLLDYLRSTHIPTTAPRQQIPIAPRMESSIMEANTHQNNFGSHATAMTRESVPGMTTHEDEDNSEANQLRPPLFSPWWQQGFPATFVPFPDGIPSFPIHQNSQVAPQARPIVPRPTSMTTTPTTRNGSEYGPAGLTAQRCRDTPREVVQSLPVRRRRHETPECSTVALEREDRRLRQRRSSSSILEASREDEVEAVPALRTSAARNEQESSLLCDPVATRTQHCDDPAGRSENSPGSTRFDITYGGTFHVGQTVPHISNGAGVAGGNVPVDLPISTTLSRPASGITNMMRPFGIPVFPDAGPTMSSTSRTSASGFARAAFPIVEGHEESRSEDPNVWRRLVKKVRRARHAFGSTASSTGNARSAEWAGQCTDEVLGTSNMETMSISAERGCVNGDASRR